MSYINIRQETLRRVALNNSLLTELTLDNNIYSGNNDYDDEFYSDNSDDYSTLGAAIANNTHLKKLIVWLSNDLPLRGVTDREFYNGLKANSSINNLRLYCHNRNIAGGVGQEILKAYQKNGNLTVLDIVNANLQNGGDRVIGDTLRNCRNLQSVVLDICNITNEQLLPIVDAVRGHNMLEELSLYDNNIGNVGYDAIAALLADPNCNLRILNLGNNYIGNEGATTIANSLTINNKLQRLYLGNNLINQTVQDIFSNILCNTSNINSLYASNHTIKTLILGGQAPGLHFASLLSMNEGANKSHVAMKKILQNHSNIDLESLFEWDAEEEQTLKALPYVMNWFERARVAVADEDEEEYNIEERKLSAIFQFSKAMPLLLEGISRIKVDKKRKRSE